MKAPAQAQQIQQGQAPLSAQQHTETDSSFMDSRPTTVTQRRLQELADNSPQAMQQKTMQSMMDTSPRAAQLRAFNNRIGRQSFPVQRVEEEEPAPMQLSAQTPAQLVQQAPQQANNTGLPNQLKAGIESLSGISMDHVKVHYNSAQPAQLNAHAYAQGGDIHLAPGQEQHLPHEAWHVVQQAQGRVAPTMQMKGAVAVNDDAGLEAEADVMGAVALSTGASQLVTQRAALGTESHQARSINSEASELVRYAPSTSASPIQRSGKDGDGTEEAGDSIELAKLPKASKRVLIHDAADVSKVGTLADRILHEVAVRVTQIFGAEVPLDTRGLPLEKLSEVAKTAPPSKTALKKAAKLAIKTSKKGATKTVTEEPSPLDLARKKLQEDEGEGQQLNPIVTNILIELRELSRTYMTALLQVSGHERGKNVFSWCGRDFVVKAAGRYVAPLANEKVAGKDSIVATEDSDFNDYDYPSNGVSAAVYKSIIEDLILGNQPKADIRTLTVFIASVGAEISRYEPQIVSVVLALTGVTPEVDNQDSVFADALTMTTGSTDPGSGSHVDVRSGFAVQPVGNRATDVAAIREGAILRAAFSHPELGLDVAAYLAQRIGEIETEPPSITIADCDDIIADLSQLLIYVMNRKSAKSGVKGTAEILKLESFLTEKALAAHFPEDFQFPGRSVENSSIVLLTPGDRVRLASELSKHDWTKEFRSSQLYDVASRAAGKKDVEFGKANIRLTNQDGKDSLAKNGNHWSGHDWAGTPKTMTPKEYEQQVLSKTADAKNERAPRKAVLSPDVRIKALYSLMEKIPSEKKRELTTALAVIQASLDSKGDLEAVSKEMASLEEVLASSAASLREILLGSRPSNEWRLMPRTWIRGAASGQGHNCLIDSLLQHVTTLDDAARRREAAAIRLQLIREGRTTAMAYLGGHEHATRVLQLIGADPAQYEVRTEWTSGSMRQLRESTGTGEHVIRLWNTGGHYEPIMVNGDDPVADDLSGVQTNTQLLRAAIPQWLQTALAAVVGDDALLELEKENAEKGESKKTFEDAGYVCFKLDAWTLGSSATPPKGNKANAFMQDAFDPVTDAKALKILLDKYAIDWKTVGIRATEFNYTITAVQDDVEAPFVFSKQAIRKK